jgi:hypothetical protein
LKDAIRATKDPDSELAQKALLQAINVPMELERKLASLWTHLDQLSQVGNENCISDIQVQITQEILLFIININDTFILFYFTHYDICTILFSVLIYSTGSS